MFRLLRYFSITSFIAIAAVIAVLVAVYRQSEITQLVALTENQNIVLTKSMSNSFWSRFSGYVMSNRETDGDVLRARPQTGAIHQTLKNLTRDLPVLKVKVFTLDGTTIYSSEAAQIGDDVRKNKGFLQAREGVPASKLVYKDSFSAFSGEVFKRDLVESYVAITNADGQPEAVFELYTDVTGPYTLIEDSVRRLIVGLLAAFGLLYGVLFFIVRRADVILKDQYRNLENSTMRMHQQNRELERLRQHAQAGSRAKSELLANMSHELRTPLNAIIGFSDTMREEVFGPLGNEKYKDYLSDIHSSGAHLLDLINDILDVSAIEAGAMELHEEEFDPAELVDASMRILKQRAKAGGVTLSSSVKPGEHVVFADSRRLKQIILNLISNAVKFTPDGGRVAVDATLTDGGSYALSVSDTGVGMDEAELEQAMSTFGQVDSGLNRKHEGTGLGLPLTKGLVEMHGGTLSVTSGKGEGTTITVTLPKARVVR